MYEKMLYDQYQSYSYEELKEITVANGYTEKAEQIARQLLSERKVETEESMGMQKDSSTSQDELQNSDSGMTVEQINQMLYDEYKTYTYEELEEITYANGYTEEAEQIAKQLLGKDVMECKEDTDTSDEEIKRHENDAVYCINCGAKCPEGARFCMKCGFKVVKKEQVERERTIDTGTTVNSDYTKLGGWLAFCAYSLLVGAVLSGIGAVIEISSYMRIAKEYSRYGIPLENTFRWLAMLTIIFCGVLMAYCFILSRMIRRRDCRFLHFYEMTMMIGCGILIVLMIYQKMKGAEITPQNVRSLLWGVIMFAVWMTYFIKSVRVRTYFGSDEYLEKSVIYKWFYGNKG